MNTNSIGYYLMPNPTDTAAQAPYLPKLVPNGVANLNDIAAKVAESLPVSEERAKLLIRENFTESLKMALAGYTVDMGALRMKTRIPGSMPCEDTPFDPETNACVIELYADGELSGAFDELVPVKLTAEQLRNAIRFSNVMDVGTQRMGEIHGTGEFMILGNGITLDGDGESAKLLNRKTGETLATAEVSTVSKGQRATCAFAAVPGGIAKGAYVLEVTTFGLVGETTPRVFRKPVTLVEAIPEPAPVPIAQTSDGVAKVWGVRDGESETELHADSNWTLVGTDLNRAEPEWRIDAAMVEVNGESYGLTFNGGPDSVVLDPGEIAALPAGEYEGGRLKLYMVKGPVDETVSETLDVALGRIIVG